MLKTALVALSLAFAGAVFADGPTCNAQAAEQKIHGAAKNSFLKKCETTAATTCEARSAEKKLFGAAKASFEKKCVKDLVE